METTATSIIFLDRDGTINVDSGYVCSPDQVELLPGVSDAIALFQNLGFRVVVVSNQSAVARGMATEQDVLATNKRVQELLLFENSGATVDLWCYSIDGPDSKSDRRKPGIGMLQDVRAQYEFDPRNCWMVGDKESDLKFGIAAGIPPAQCVLLPSRYVTASIEETAQKYGSAYADSLAVFAKSLKAVC